jgi:hypothetical protein
MQMSVPSKLDVSVSPAVFGPWEMATMPARIMSDAELTKFEINWRDERTLSQALTLQYDKVMFILEPTEAAQAAIGMRVTVYDYPDGRLVIRHEGVDLPYRTFDKIRKVNQAAITENKRLGSLLDLIRQSQDMHEPDKRSVGAPKRWDQSGHMFGVG